MSDDWKQELRYSFQKFKSLQDYLHLRPEECPFELCHEPDFPFRVPVSFAMRMAKRHWQDPLLLQVLPIAEEEKEAPGFSPDPLQEQSQCQLPGLLRKYRNRVLLVSSSNCAIHCRFCFRRQFDYAAIPQTEAEWRPVWQALSEEQEVNEVILSGGDPFLAETDTIKIFLLRLSCIAHIQTVRFHTRLPVILPSRVNQELISLLTQFNEKRFRLVSVIHANHPHELSGDCLQAIARLRHTGMLLLNQSVLLRGINDDADAQIALSRSLIRAGVLPYYLHQLDRVQGVHHFEVPEERGRAIIEEMKKALPGYAVPRYVRDLPDSPFKSDVV